MSSLHCGTLNITNVLWTFVTNRNLNLHSVLITNLLSLLTNSSTFKAAEHFQSFFSLTCLWHLSLFVQACLPISLPPYPFSFYPTLVKLSFPSCFVFSLIDHSPSKFSLPGKSLPHSHFISLHILYHIPRTHFLYMLVWLVFLVIKISPRKISRETLSAHPSRWYSITSHSLSYYLIFIFFLIFIMFLHYTVSKFIVVNNRQ